MNDRGITRAFSGGGSLLSANARKGGKQHNQGHQGKETADHLREHRGVHEGLRSGF